LAFKWEYKAILAVLISTLKTEATTAPPIWALKLLCKSVRRIVFFKEIRIFLVDDGGDISLLYKTGLERHGFLVDAFNDPVLVLLSYKAGEYDLLLLDIKMPKIRY